jgi:hypothetical protein
LSFVLAANASITRYMCNQSKWLTLIMFLKFET